MATLTLTPRLAVSCCCCARAVRRRLFSSSPASRSAGSFRRSDYSNQGYSGVYDAGAPTLGPLADASLLGAPRLTPKLLKQHLDDFVVGQERAKKILSVAVYNHYQRIQELQRREDEEEELLAQQSRREYVRHPVEGREKCCRANVDEFPGQQSTTNMYSPPQYTGGRYNPAPAFESPPLNIEKSNVLLLGPSGVGKSLMAKTLAQVLDVPYSMSDCTPFTQAGYIGEDADVCVQRLLAAANYDVARAERGIICLDEIDKIATARVSHGKDVSGEGVQQALLKIIEGTTVQVQAKQERSSASQKSGMGYNRHEPTSSQATPGAAPAKGEVYNVQTDNILFICTGAFIGLHRTIMDRLARGSIGFGAQMRTFSDGAGAGDATDPTIPAGNAADEELFAKHLPFFQPAVPEAETKQHKSVADFVDEEYDGRPRYNTLDLATPTDLQKYGIIPELVGRIPIICALAPLDLRALVRVLTEPRNSLVAQYTALFALSGIELRFSSPAIVQIAKNARGMGTGARGLRSVLERLLADSMYECPGQGIRHVLVTRAAAANKQPCRWYLRAGGGPARFAADLAADEDEWEREQRRVQAGRRRAAGEAAEAEAEGDGDSDADGAFASFSQYREKAKVAGSG